MFASSPVAAVTNYNDALAGVHSTFDGLGRLTASTQDSELGPLTTRYAYLPGFVTQVTNPRGYSTGTGYQVFDAPDTGHPTAIVSPEGVTTTIARDVFGKPLAITRSGTWNGSPISESRHYVYDTHQRLCKRVEPESGASFASYDAANNIAWTATGSTLTAIDSAAQCEADRAAVPATSQTVRSYDARNRVLTVNIPNSTDDLAYSYFNDGALKTLSNGAGASLNTWTYTYTRTRLPLTETLAIDGRSEVIGHGYDAYGHASGLTYPDGLTIATAPNALGQPTQAGAYASAIAYFPNGGMSGFSYGNGIVHTLTQNTRELPLRSLDQKPGQSAILDDTYTYDANANVAAIADDTAGNADSRTMAYDGLDRLTSTNAPHQWWISATTTYDALDNIRANQVGNTATYLNTFSYDPTTWHLTAIAGHVNWALSYDQNGNVTSKGTGNDSYAFDAANRLTAVTGKESYRYDGYGRRVKITRSTDGKIDYPVYDRGGQLLTEDDQRSNQTTDYVSLNGSLVAKRASAIGKNQWTTTWEHTDALRSPRLETSASGALTRAELYTPYGEPGDGKYVQGPGYTGHVTDAATHLTYAQQRYYDPVMGRFLSTDPIQVNDAGGDFNRYWYATNNPYRFNDSDGAWPTDIHERIIDAAFPAMPAAQRTILKSASYWMDHGPTSQSAFNSYQHSMRAPGQDIAEAKGLTRGYILMQEAAARKALGYTPTDIASLNKASLMSLGDALHTATDGTSPAHVDANGNPRVWSGIPTTPSEVSALNQHVAEESSISPGQMKLAVQAARQVFKDAFGGSMLDQAITPRQNFFSDNGITGDHVEMSSSFYITP